MVFSFMASPLNNNKHPVLPCLPAAKTTSKGAVVAGEECVCVCGGGGGVKYIHAHAHHLRRTVWAHIACEEPCVCVCVCESQKNRIVIINQK